MNYGTSSGNPGPSSQFDVEHVQKTLRSLLEDLDWSYVALWSFNPQSRNLEWAGGHFKGNSPAQSSAEVLNIQLFNMQKTCTFAPGQGSVGMAYADKQNIWKNGPSVHFSAGSEVQAEILKHARIETAMYILSAETVLELGTSSSEDMDMHLMNTIHYFMREHILPALGQAQAPPHAVSQAPLAPLSSHLVSHGRFLNQGFSALNEQTRRLLPSSSNIDMFLQHPEEDRELGLTSSVPTGSTWVSSSPTTSHMLQATSSPSLPVSAANHQMLMMFQDYRSLSGTTSSSLSSLEDTSVKPSADSPDQSISLMAPSSQRLNSHNYPSSSATRETPSHSPELQFVDHTTGIPGGSAPPLHDIQHAIQNLMVSQETWPQIMYGIDPSSLEPEDLQQPGVGFKTWRQITHVPRRRERRSPANHGLLRRSFEILRQIRDLQQLGRNPPAFTFQEAASLPNRGHCTRLPSSSSPEDLPPAQNLPEQQAGPSRGSRRNRGTGTRASDGEEAARRIHMLSERHRRQKQKENFSVLRNLVPIISKNDKASILGDAILYIKELEVQLQDAEAAGAELQSRYDTLQSSHQELQERNKQLEARVADPGSSSSRSTGGPSSIPPPPPPPPPA